MEIERIANEYIYIYIYIYMYQDGFSPLSFTWEWLALSLFFFCFHLAFSSRFPSCNFLSQINWLGPKSLTFSPLWLLLHFMTFASTASLPFELVFNSHRIIMSRKMSPCSHLNVDNYILYSFSYVWDY